MVILNYYFSLILRMINNKILEKVSEKTNIPLEIVSKVYDCYWLYIRNTIQDLPLKDNLSEEEFNKLRTNFNIPSLGKLTCDYNRLQGVKKRYKYLKNL